MKPAAILGSLVDMKNVAVHKSVRLIIDIPAEQAEDIIKAFGWPTQVNPVPVAVARLTPSAAESPATVIPSAAPAERPPTRGFSAETPRSWHSLPYPQQAGIRSNDGLFRAFLKEDRKWKGEPDEFIRQYCGVSSRAFIKAGTEAGKKWEVLNQAFESWRLLDKVM